MADKRTNWAKTHDFTPARDAESKRHPLTFTELREQVRKATEAGRHVHAVGSYWSFSDAPAGNDVSIGPAHDEKTDPAIAGGPDGLKLREIAKGPTYSGKLGGALTAAVKTAGKSYARVGCLVAVKEAIDALATEGLGLVTMGSRSGQRVIGVCSTGTHGGDFDLAPIADTIRAIHVITHGGQDVWIEPSARLTSDAGVKLLDGVSPAVKIVASDEVFEAAIVSVGALGVVASLVLEVRPMYGLSERVRWMEWSDVRAKLIDGSVFTDVAGLTDPARPHPATGRAAAPLRNDGYRHLEILINPYPDEDGVRWAFVATRVEHPSWDPKDFDRNEAKISDAAIYFAVELGGPDKYHETLRDLIGSTRADTPAAHRYLSVQDTKGRKSQPAYSSELVISTAGGQHVAAIDDMLAQIDRLTRDTRWKFSGFLSLRFTRASRASLAMQSSADASERFCHVEVFALQELTWFHVDPKNLEGRNEDYVDALFDVSERFEGRAHWGQWAHPEHPHSIERFPRKADFLAAKQTLAGAAPIASFDNPFTVRAGLVPTRGWDFVGDGVIPTRATHAPYDTRALRERAPSIVVGAKGSWIAAASGDGAPALARHDGSRWRSFAELSLEGDRHVDGSLVLAANHDGRLELFARVDDGRIFHAWARKTPDQRLTSFTDFDGDQRFVASPAVVREIGGRLVMLAVDTNKKILRRRQRDAGGTWHDWGPTGSRFVAGGCAAVWDKGIVIAARDTSGKLVLGAQEIAQGQSNAAPDAPFQWHSTTESADADPTIITSSQGVIVVYFQGGVLRAFAVPASELRTSTAPVLRPVSNPGTPPLIASQPGAMVATVNGSAALVVAYPIARGALAQHRHALSGGTWTAETIVEAKLVSAVSLVATGTHVTAVGKLAHDLVVRRVIV
jgi:hypothetical protein